jgi:hypothetical protein
MKIYEGEDDDFAVEVLEDADGDPELTPFDGYVWVRIPDLDDEVYCVEEWRLRENTPVPLDDELPF